MAFSKCGGSLAVDPAPSGVGVVPRASYTIPVQDPSRLRGIAALMLDPLLRAAPFAHPCMWHKESLKGGLRQLRVLSSNSISLEV